MRATKQEVEWSKKGKTYKVNYFAALGELFKELESDKNGMEAISRGEGKEITGQEGVKS